MNESESSTTEIVLVDLSSVAHPIWHMTKDDGFNNAASQAIANRVRELAHGRPHVAICCDAGRSFRHRVAETYKANRIETDAPFYHQVRLAVDALKADGFPIWAAEDFEADDVIASAALLAVEQADRTVLIVTADKDLLQLVCDGVRVFRLAAGKGEDTIYDAAMTAQKFGVPPDRMGDFLMLCGDSSDNIKGAVGIGPKRAPELLAKFGSLDAMVAKLQTGTLPEVPLGQIASLREYIGSARFAQNRTLIALRTDAPVPFAEIFEPRRSRAVTPPSDDGGLLEEEFPMLDLDPVPIPAPSLPTDVPTPTTSAPTPEVSEAHAPESPRALTVTPPTPARPAEVLPPAPDKWELQLDPRSTGQALSAAQKLFLSGMFTAQGYGSPEAIFATILAGRELGIPMMSSLRSIFTIKGRFALSAQLIVGLVLRSGFAEYFEVESLDDAQCTYVTKRKKEHGGSGREIRVTHTLEMARVAGAIKADSAWEKHPQDMLVARASVRLARMVFSDVTANLYCPEELDE